MKNLFKCNKTSTLISDTSKSKMDYLYTSDVVWNRKNNCDCRYVSVSAKIGLERNKI